MFKQVLDPVSHSLGLSSIFAILPLLTLFILLGVMRMKAQWASLLALLVALDRRHRGLLDADRPGRRRGLEGAAFGFFPIMWIVINALWIYNMTVETGHFEVLRRSFATISSDQRVQVVMIAFCFGALLEALAGFGTPVAICGVMLVGLGSRPSEPRPSRSWPIPLRWRSVRSRSPSPRWPRSPGFPCTTWARWSVARRPSSP